MFDKLAGSWSSRCRLAIAAVVAVFIGSVVVLLLLAGHLSGGRSISSARGAPTSASNRPTAPVRTSASSSGSVVLPALPPTDDPAAYAREVAAALFDVSPAEVSRAEFVQFWRGELPTVVYSDGAAKGLTLPVQNADAMDNLTSSWIPPASAWDGEAAEHTTNHFTISSVSVPDYWVNAVAEGTFRDPGLHMERVMGVLTQTYGTDPTHRQSSAQAVVIDLGLLCGPTQPGGCRLLAPQPPPSAGDASQ
jgi:hypothetical protein